MQYVTYLMISYNFYRKICFEFVFNYWILYTVESCHTHIYKMTDFYKTKRYVTTKFYSSIEKCFI